MTSRPLNTAPAWVRILVRLLVLAPLWPLHIAGQFSDWAFGKIDPHLPRGL